MYIVHTCCKYFIHVEYIFSSLDSYFTLEGRRSLYILYVNMLYYYLCYATLAVRILIVHLFNDYRPPPLVAIVTFTFFNFFSYPRNPSVTLLQ